MSTRLYHRLCDAGGLVYDCSAAWEPFDDLGIVDIAAEVQHARLVDVVTACLAMCTELAIEGPTQGELEKARDRHQWAIDAALDDAGELADVLGGAVLFDRPRTLRATADRLTRVTAADVRDVAASIFKRETMTVVTVGHLGKSSREGLRAALRAFRR